MCFALHSIRFSTSLVRPACLIPSIFLCASMNWEQFPGRGQMLASIDGPYSDIDNLPTLGNLSFQHFTQCLEVSRKFLKGFRQESSLEIIAISIHLG